MGRELGVPSPGRSPSRYSPGVGHALHGHLRGASHHAGVPGWDNDGGCDGISRATHVWEKEERGKSTSTLCSPWGASAPSEANGAPEAHHLGVRVLS